MASSRSPINTEVLEGRRVIVIGKTGNGKSATINQIFGHRVVEAKSWLTSVTKRCKFVEEPVEGKSLLLIDTPGLYDTVLSPKETKQEINRGIGLSSPGFHAFILVLKIGNRFTIEECDTLTQFASMFGPELYQRTIILFTQKDQLDKDGNTFEEYTEKLSPELTKVIDTCGNRVVGFDNFARGEERYIQIKGLMRLIEEIVRSNRNTYYTNETFQVVARMIEEEIKRRQDEERKKKEAKDMQRAEARENEEEIDRRQSEIRKKQAEIDRQQSEARKELKEEAMRQSEARKKQEKEDMRQSEIRKKQDEIERQQEYEDEEKRKAEIERDIRREIENDKGFGSKLLEYMGDFMGVITDSIGKVVDKLVDKICKIS